MTVIADYTPEEQQLLRTSVEAAAIAISAASLGRGEETVSEGFAAAEFVMQSQPQYTGNTLVTSIIVETQARVKAGDQFPDYSKEADKPGAEQSAMDALTKVAALLDAKATTDEAFGYKQWLLDIADVTAKAGKEDQGFLGHGGVKVNDAERQKLEDIANALGIPEHFSQRAQQADPHLG